MYFGHLCCMESLFAIPIIISRLVRLRIFSRHLLHTCTRKCRSRWSSFNDVCRKSPLIDSRLCCDGNPRLLVIDAGVLIFHSLEGNPLNALWIAIDVCLRTNDGFSWSVPVQGLSCDERIEPGESCAASAVLKSGRITQRAVFGLQLVSRGTRREYKVDSCMHSSAGLALLLFS